MMSRFIAISEYLQRCACLQGKTGSAAGKVPGIIAAMPAAAPPGSVKKKDTETAAPAVFRMTIQR